MSKKIAIVANRLPVVVRKKSGKFEFVPSDGGLSSALESAQIEDSIWVGWPGIASDDLSPRDKQEIKRGLTKYNCQPVFLTQAQIDLFYSGYCNSTLWPLFHYFADKADFSEEMWRSYKFVNKAFARQISKANFDRIWVHDYQLMLLPSLLRESGVESRIGFFLHTPFPSFELFRLLPERAELLEGLLGADLVGFHTYDYLRHFLNSVLQSLGHENNLGRIKLGNREVKTDALPIGIDYDKFARSINPEVASQIKELFNLKGIAKVIASVDRLDYSKGLPERLRAIERFVADNRAAAGKFVFAFLAVPSRTQVKAYKDLKQKVESEIKRINAKYSTKTWQPIEYRYQKLSLEQTRAFYDRADVMLVTPVRDGMNLVAKEYVATKRSGGALVLSDMAGVSRELIEAELVNPNHDRSVAAAIKKAIYKPNKTAMIAMKERVSGYTAKRWAGDFLQELGHNHAMDEEDITMDKQSEKSIMRDYKQAGKRLILLDYDGTLKAFVPTPDAESAMPSDRLKAILKSLSSNNANRVVVVSGRPRSAMEKFFGDNNKIGLVAEHGGWQFVDGEWVRAEAGDMNWKDKVRPVLEKYAGRTPGAVVEEKDFALVWHYRRSSPELAYIRVEEIKAELEKELVGSEIGMFDGQKILEIKPKGMHKGALISRIAGNQKWDFIMAAGDDYTDEDMFRALPSKAYTIKLGDKDTIAKYRIETVDGMVELLDRLG